MNDQSGNTRSDYVAAAILCNLNLYGSLWGHCTAAELEANLESYGLDFLTTAEIEEALEKFERSGYVRGFHDPHASTRYLVTDEGRGYVGLQIEHEAGLIHMYHTLGDSWLSEVLKNLPLREETASGTSAASDTMDTDEDGVPVIDFPASDRTVTLDDNSDPYKEAMGSLDQVVAAFRDDHGLDNELGREKPALLQALEGAKELLSDRRVRFDAVETLVLRPLQLVQSIAERYERELISGLAATAIAAIAKLVGLL